MTLPVNQSIVSANIHAVYAKRVFTLRYIQLENRKDNVQFTFEFLKVFFYGLELALPLLVFMIFIIIVVGQIVGKRESWARFDALYWSFITATTVGYGDIRPSRKSSKILSILVAFVGLIFTGIVVALALNAASIAFSSVHDGMEPKTIMESIQ